MSTDALLSSLDILIETKGGLIRMQELVDCDTIFRPNNTDKISIEILGNLWLDGNETLARVIETQLEVLTRSKASDRAFNELYTTEIFCRQKFPIDDQTLVIRRLCDPATQPLPPNIQDRAPSKNSEAVQLLPPHSPHSRAIKAVSQDKRKPANSARCTDVARISVSADRSTTSPPVQRGVSVPSVVPTAATTSNSYTSFIIDVQYWLSEEILEPGLQKQARFSVPRLFGRSPYYAPNLTVLMVDHRGADTDEYRRKPVAVSSTCLYQSHRLFESSKKRQKKQAQLTNKAGPKPMSEGQEEYVKRREFHYEILMDGLAFEVFAIRPLLSETTTNWRDFEANRIAAAYPTTPDDIRTLLHWVSKIHRWGVTKNLGNLNKSRKRNAARQSLVAHPPNKELFS
ncbi:hypothetical protein MMC18_004655 [Xylographa bjoerkii]|nr:hypothetical protein [Xylographa bjoerkii]